MAQQQLSCDCRHSGVSDGDRDERIAKIAARKPGSPEVAGAATVRSDGRSAVGADAWMAGSTRSPIRTAVLAGLVTGALLGCADSQPTGPGASPPPQASTLRITPELQVAFQAALADADQRVIPALGEQADATAVTVALSMVGEALTSRDPRALGRAVQTAERALGELGRGPDADLSAMQADLDAVRLILSRARLLLTSPDE